MNTNNLPLEPKSELETDALEEQQYFDYYFFTGSTDEELIKKYDWIRSKNREADTF